MHQEATYHSSGNFTLSPQKWLAKVGQAFQPQDAVLLAIRAMTLAGAGRIEVRRWWGRCEVTGKFAAPPAVWLDEHGWNERLLTSWPDQLLEPEDQGLYDLCLALAAASQGIQCQLRWKQGWSSSRLDFSGWGPPHGSTNSAPTAAVPLRLAFSCSQGSDVPIGRLVQEATTYSPIPVVYVPGAFETPPAALSRRQYLPHFGLMEDCRLAQWLQPPLDQHWGRSLGVPGRATLELPSLESQRPTREVFWRTATHGPVPVGAQGVPLADRCLELEVGERPGRCSIVRGGVTLETLPLDRSGIHLVLSDRGLQLDASSRRVVDNSALQQAVSDCLALVPELARQAERMLPQLDFLAPMSTSGETLGTVLLGITMLVGALAGADLSAGSTFNGSQSEQLGACSDPHRLEPFREAVRQRLRKYQEV